MLILYHYIHQLTDSVYDLIFGKPAASVKLIGVFGKGVKRVVN